MRCYRRLLNIIYKDHVTNEEVRRKSQAAIGEYDELLTLVKKRKLRWFGHVSWSSGLAKTILQGTVKGKRGRQKKRWEGNIKEWTGMDFASSTRAAENRSRWKGILRIHLSCPDDLPRLWDRIEWNRQWFSKMRRSALYKNQNFILIECTYFYSYITSVSAYCEY